MLPKILSFLGLFCCNLRIKALAGPLHPWSTLFADTLRVSEGATLGPFWWSYTRVPLQAWYGYKQNAEQASVSLNVSPTMRAAKASVFSLDVIVHDVTHETGHDTGSFAGNSLAIACRFLDYPLIFIRPRSEQRQGQTAKFNNGKSCALSEVKTCLKDSLQQVCLVLIYSG
jgi:hypothetical protein